MSFLTEDINEYVGGINSLNDMFSHPGGRIVYQRTGSGISLYDKTRVYGLLNNIKACGLSREYGGSNGEAFGEGLYTSLLLSDCQANSDGYGHIMLKVWLAGFNRCLIDSGCHVYGHDLAVQTYGRNSSIYDQCVKLMGQEAAAKYKHCNTVRNVISCMPEDIFQEYDIDGIIYNWTGGHWVCVWKDYKKAFPVAYSLDYGKTFRKLGDEGTLNITLKTWEPTRVLGSDIHKYKNPQDARVVNGFMRLEYIEGGYIFIDPKQGRHPIPSVKFDKATDADENGVAQVKYNNELFYYHIPTDTIYTYDSEMDSETLVEVGADYDMLLGKSKDLPKLTANTSVPVQESKIIIHEDVDEYIAGANRDTIHDRDKSGLVCFYRLGFPHQTKSIAMNGFTKEFRGFEGRDKTDWIGSGTYGCVDSHWRTGHNYGSILWAYGTPAELVAKTYISPNPYLARRFGIQGTFGEQLERFFPDLVPEWKRRGVWKQLLEPGHYDSNASENYGFKVFSGSAQMKRLNAMVFDGDNGKSDHYYHAHGINGIIYHGNKDGDAVLTFDDSTIIPLAWRDNSKQGDKWHQVEITDTLWDRTFNGYDPLPFLKGTYRDYEDHPNEISRNYRVINGYMKVRRKKDGKCNYIKAPEGGRTFASEIWFDNASDLDHNKVGMVKYNNELFYYHAPTDTIYTYDSEMDTEMLVEVGAEYDMLLGKSKDLPRLTSSQPVQEYKPVFGNLLEETLRNNKLNIY